MSLSVSLYRLRRSARGLGLLALVWVPLSAQVAVRNQGYVPFSEEPIRYLADNVADPVALLQKRLERGEVSLEYDGEHGYLRSVLQALKIPVTSQTLVFSKTSFQYKKISPQTPRALYFNDDVYVGQVHDGKVLEFVSFDPRQGAIFYVLDEQKSEHPAFQRAELDCTQCHVAAGTRGVPGVLLRSIYPTASGYQADKTPAFITGHESPLKERWGGWYVTGAHQKFMGNAVVGDAQHPDRMAPVIGAFNAGAYLSPESDIVAHLVLAHQTQMHNLITLTNYQTRLAQYAKGDAKQYQHPAEELVRYLLFANEAPLDAPVSGASSFAEEFVARGPRDARGRSLREFDLRTRIFKYPCSYLIYSEAFDALPAPAKDYVYHRIFEVLTGRERGPEFAKLSAEDRTAILEILLATKPGLPEEWNQTRRQAHSGEDHPGSKRSGSASN
jgi:hypothetical protein